jgi:ABC-type transport system substrate-binding protein
MVKSKGIDQFTTELVKNPNYWRKDKAGKQLPYADTLTFKAVLDGGQRVNALAKGQADISIFGATSGQQLNRMKTMKNVKLYEGARVTNWTIHFNTTAAPFNNQSAREAVAYALDRVSYAKVLCGGNCSAATSIAPKGHPLYFPGMITYDLAKAKEKVAAYKTETGKDLDISVPISDTAESTAEATMYCTMMKAAGAGCSLMAPVTSTAYILRGFGLKQQTTEFNTLSGTYAEFGLLFLTDTNLELSGFRFTNPALAACFKNAQMVALKGDATPYKPCMEELQGKTIWTGVYTEGLFFATGTGVTGITDTALPDGGTRDAVQPGFGDWAMISKA